MHTTTSSRSDLDVDVLVVGAGPSGLTTAISAARHGASVLVVERHAGLSQFPKATGVRPRIMEILRSWGLDEDVRAASQPARLAMLITPTLPVPGTEISMGLPTDADLEALSPGRIAVCPQDRLEAILLAHLVDPGADLDAEVRFGHRLRRFELLSGDASSTGASGVRAVVDGPDGTLTVTARYLVGADGARSEVRAASGIELIELGSEGNHVSVLFRADLTSLVADPPYVLTMTVAPGLEGMLVATGEPDRWIYDLEWHPERGETLAQWPAARMVARLRAVTGRPDLRPEVLGLFPWDFGAAVAAEQRRGPVFLVGDAAHRTTPRGATGMNTGMADGHNLGWKLAWAARGLAGSALLDSYQQERGPVGRANAEASLVSRMGAPSGSALDHDFGVEYVSDVIAVGDRLAGRRAPHAWVSLNGRRRSAVDLFDGRLTLMVGPDGDGWVDAGRRVADSGVPIVVHRIGAEMGDPDGGLCAAYGLGAAGCVLVRPDGYVAWSQSTAPDETDSLSDRVGYALGLADVRVPVR